MRQQLRMRKSGSSSAPPLTPSEEDRLRKTLAATSLLEFLIVAEPSSPLVVQSAAYRKEGKLEEWLDKSSAGLALRFEAATVEAALREWKRLIRDCPRTKDPLDVAGYLQLRAEGGPTAAPGVVSRLSWLNLHLQTSFPVDDQLIKRWKTPPPGHIPVGQDPITLKLFEHLCSIAISDAASATLRNLCRVYLRWLSAGLRFTHALRASRQADLSNEFREIWFISRGKKKDRAGYYVPIPTYVLQQQAW